METSIIAFLLGILEGATEFIPVSSTGHLILASSLLDFSGSAHGTFEVFIQLGAILAVVFLYPDRFIGLFRDLKAPLTPDGFTGKVGLGKIGLATFPALLTGYLLHSTIKSKLFFPLPVALALVVGGIVLIFIERRLPKPSTTTIEGITFRDAFLVGCFQCLALWPGISRSGATIVGALILGCDRQTAARFSFLIAVPVMCAAVGYDLLKSWDQLSLSDLAPFSIGFITSFGTAILAIRFFLHLLGRFDLKIFGYYRALLGLLVIALARFL